MTINKSALTQSLRASISPHAKDGAHAELALIKVLIHIKPIVQALEEHLEQNALKITKALNGDCK